MPEVAQLPDVSEAMKLLDAAEAAETPPAPEAFVQTEPDAEAPQAAPEPADGGTKPSELAVDGTPAAADPKPAEPKVEDPTETNAPKPPAKDGFSKDRQRRDDSWKKLEAEKTAFRTEREQFKAEQEFLARERATIDRQKAEAANRYSPEQYEQAATANSAKADALELQADGLDRRADKSDEDGDYDAARRLRAEAAGIRRKSAYHAELSGELKAEAKHKRDHPDPDAARAEQGRQQALKDYTLEANKRWPDVFKQGSDMNQTVVAHLQAARQAGLDVKDHPVLIYHAARLTAAEAAAARVPAMTKELGELRAKVKELEAFSAPGGGLGAPANLTQEQPKSDEDEGALLRDRKSVV